jgi:hypothetical protein
VDDMLAVNEWLTGEDRLLVSTAGLAPPPSPNIPPLLSQGLTPLTALGRHLFFFKMMAF